MGLVLASGCQLDRIQPVLPFNRHGEYCFLIKNYGSDSVGFRLWGKALCHQDSASITLPSLLSPTRSFFLLDNVAKSGMRQTEDNDV